MNTIWDVPVPSLGMGDPRTLDARFRGWMATDEGREVVSEIRVLNRRIRGRGFDHYSIGALSEVVRWHRHLEKGPEYESFKVNDSYLSRLARFLMDVYPDEFPSKCRCHRHAKEPLTYFELRSLRS